MPIKTIHIIPRWAGQPQDDWYPWLRKELEQHFPGIRCRTYDMPQWQMPTIEQALDYLSVVTPGNQLGSSDLLIGHSVGCQAWLRYLATLHAQGHNRAVGGMIAVAGWFKLDHRFPGSDPWLDEPFVHEAVRALLPEGRLKLLLSDNDPFTSNYKENMALWKERLGASIHMAEGAGHFNDASMPPVWELLTDLMQPQLA